MNHFDLCFFYVTMECEVFASCFAEDMNNIAYND